MFDHVGIVVREARRSLAFYEACLAPLGIRLVERQGDSAAVFFADPNRFLWVGSDRPSFWNASHKAAASPLHLCFVADSAEAVDGFHKAALATGGSDNGAPGWRGEGEAYYAAYVLDPDGNNIEAAWRKVPR